jgi:putative nucleotidyltransferase with HDIG domain
MALNLSLEDQEHLADTLRRAGSEMTRRELLAKVLVGCGFVIAAAAVLWIRPPHGFALGPALLCLAVTVLATRVRFDTPFGFTVATQLAFVPLLFAMPVALVPIAFMSALAIALVPEILSGEIGPSRLLHTPGNSWSAIFPVLVFALADVAPRAAGPLLLLAALAAQFGGDFLISAVYTGIERQAGIRSQLRESWVYVIDAALSGVGLVVAEELDHAPYAVLATVPLLGLLAMFAHERRGRLGSVLELKDTYRGTALLLGDVIAADDGYTGEHSQGVLGLVLAVADQLGLDAEGKRNLEFGALLHDVGKIAIPKEIINKPAKLDPHEWELVKTHTVEGEKMLSRVGGFMIEVGSIVRSHHERWDGAGYPDGLPGPEIPLEARIISCCDAWSAMRTDRPYRAALTHETALEQIRSNTGTQFDPEVVAALLSALALAELELGPAGAGDGISERPVATAQRRSRLKPPGRGAEERVLAQS